MGAFAVFAPRPSPEQDESPPARSLVPVLAPLALFALGFGLLIWPDRWTPRARAQDPGAHRILFWEEGLLEFTMPEAGRYGGDALGVSFGYLPGALEMLGYETARAGGELTAETLMGTGVLVVINLREPFSESEHRTIWEFVEKGGSLLVLGDHTNVGGTRSALNRLLEPSGMRLRFDSAIQDGTRGWRDVLLQLPHPAIAKPRSSEEIGIVVGASLDTPHTALPLYTARRGISDMGNEDNAQRAYLGTMRYEPGEQRGDLVLAALVRHGRGRVVAFGDTSTFQTSEVAQSWRAIGALFGYLTSPPRGLSKPVRGAGALLALLALAAGLWPATKISFTIRASLLMAALVFVTGSAHNSTVDLSPQPRPAVAWIEASHLERIGPETWHYPDTIGGLIYNLMRAGTNPLIASRFEDLDLRPGDTLIVVAPARRFSSSETEEILDFCRAGGRLLLAVGHEERHGALPLLDALGIEIEPTPLGGAPDAADTTTGQPVRFYEAWPLAYRETPDILIKETLVTAYGRPLVVRRMIGNGTATVIGDTWFFSSRNLEDSRSFVQQNVEYFPTLMQHAAGEDPDREPTP